MAVRGKWWIVAGLILFALLAALAWNWSTLRARAQLGSAYGARLTCSCRYVEGRAMGSCQGDKEPGMAMVRLTDKPEERAVEAQDIEWESEVGDPAPLVARMEWTEDGWAAIEEAA